VTGRVARQGSGVSSATKFGVTRPRHVAVTEVMVRPTEQER
jgi:NADP-dependent 3-hydroxy acid dehydrogenase YdfG